MQDNLLKWIGGKHSLAPFILSKMAPHYRYIELFAGALHMFFQKPLARINIVNDLNGNLVNMYKVIKNNKQREELAEELNQMWYGRDLFLWFKDLYKSEDMKYLKPVHKAAIFIYLNRISFNGMFQSFSHREESNFNVPILINIMKKMARKLEAGNTVVENMPFQEILNNPTYVSPGTLIYLDPPYWVTATAKGAKYYEKKMLASEHEELRHLLGNKCQGCKWLMSYDDVPEIRRLYEDWAFVMNTPEMHQSSATASVKEGAGIFKSELLIANYDLMSANTLFEGVPV